VSGFACWSKLMKMNPSHSSQRTGTRPYLLLSDVEELVLLLDEGQVAVQAVAPAWYLQVNCLQVPEVSSCG